MPRKRIIPGEVRSHCDRLSHRNRDYLGERKPFDLSITIIRDPEPSPAYLALMCRLLAPAPLPSEGQVAA
jgi:hypothetical protein